MCEPCSRLHVRPHCCGFTKGGWEEPQANTKLKEKEVAVIAEDKKYQHARGRQSSSVSLAAWSHHLPFWPVNPKSNGSVHFGWVSTNSHRVLAGGYWAKWGLAFTLTVVCCHWRSPMVPSVSEWLPAKTGWTTDLLQPLSIDKPIFSKTYWSQSLSWDIFNLHFPFNGAPSNDISAQAKNDE